MMSDKQIEEAENVIRSNQEKLEDEMGDFDENYDYDQSFWIKINSI